MRRSLNLEEFAKVAITLKALGLDFEGNPLPKVEEQPKFDILPKHLTPDALAKRVIECGVKRTVRFVAINRNCSDKEAAAEVRFAINAFNLEG